MAKNIFALLPKSFSKMALASAVGIAALSPVNAATLEQLEKQLKDLQKEINALKSQKGPSRADGTPMGLKEQVDEINDRLDAVELDATLSKVKIGFDMTNAFYSSSYAHNSSSYKNPNGKNDKQSNRWATEFHLNLLANINERTKFTGRLAMTKAWGDFGNTNTTVDTDQGRGFDGGSVLYVDRAFVDFGITDNLIFTIGRQPGTDGPGYNLRNNSARMGTYPALAANAIADGAVLTYNFNNKYNTSARIAYAKIFQEMSEDSFVRSPANDGVYAKDSNMFFGILESDLPVGSMGKTTAIASVAHITDMSAPIGDNVRAGVGALGAYVRGDTLNLGSLTNYTLHLENYNTFGSGLNWFAAFGYMDYGKESSKSPRNQILDGMNLSGAARDAMKKQLEAIGFQDKDAWATHIGARYDFNTAFKLGAEWFHGSDTWYALSRPSINDPFNIRSTRGDAFDIYAIYQIDLYQFLRLSYTYIKYSHTGSGSPLGVAVKMSEAGDNEVKERSGVSVAYTVRF